MLKLAGDTHTHTIACQHAYSTVLENAAYAKKLGHRFLALTDHGPQMAGCVHSWYFMNLPKFVPRELDGVVLLRGCEANILENGTLDLPEAALANLDWVIASMHRGLTPQELSEAEYTAYWLKIAENPYIDCIGHLGNSIYRCDYPAVIEAVAAHGKVVEINSSSPISRPGCEEACHQIIRLCKEYGVPLVLSSDAHFATGIGNVAWASQAVLEEDYPTENILNLDYRRMADWLQAKKGLLLPD
ncbi:MAG: phosphatase [Angelakisella sp.]